MEKFVEVMFLVIFIILLFVVIGVAIFECFGDAEVIYQEISVNSGEKIEEICEHNYVITSEYDWFRESYRTISKCAKCGHVVR